jgi:hypothetical protein
VLVVGGDVSPVAVAVVVVDVLGVPVVVVWAGVIAVVVAFELVAEELELVEELFEPPQPAIAAAAASAAQMIVGRLTVPSIGRRGSAPT